MTVFELIQALQEMPQEATVLCWRAKAQDGLDVVEVSPDIHTFEGEMFVDLKIA